MSRKLYSLIIYLLLPFAWLRLYWRGQKEPGYRKNIGERFGYYHFKIAQPVIWVHAVSVGETRAASPLIAAIKNRFPGHQILITHMTPTGRATGESLFGDTVWRCYLPYDAPFAVQRFLYYFRPTLGLIMETEIWPNLIAQCNSNKIPLWLVNARMSEKSAKGYARFATLIADSLGKLTGICAQTTADAAQLKLLGASHVEICGNVKFDISPPEDMLQLGTELRERFGKDRPVFMAASTRENEEEFILEALRKITLENLLTVIVPRHPQRFETVAALIQKEGFNFQRRSSNEAIAPTTHIVLGDSMGEMFAYYAACDIAFIGGSLLPLGGQNLIEACAVGKPVLVGPHTFNFSEATEQAIDCGAARRIEDVSSLAAEITNLFNHAQTRERMSAAGLTFTQMHRGAVKQILKVIRQQPS